MKIVFVWINNFRNLKNAGFNLGSEYNYELELDKKKRECKLTRTPNNNFIPDFFDPILNITAIVGENASGKSSFIDALYPDFLSSNYKESTCLILYKYESEYLYYINFDDNEFTKLQIPSWISLTSDEPNENNFIEEKPPWKVFLNNKQITEKDNSINKCVIKYSSFIDLNSGLHGGDYNNGYIDISANHLLYTDVSDGFKESFGNEPLNNHKYNTTKQCVKFILEWKDSKFIDYILKSKDNDSSKPHKTLFSDLDKITILNTYEGRRQQEINVPQHSGKEKIKEMCDFTRKVLRRHITQYINNNNPTSPHHFDVFIGSVVDSVTEALYLSYRDFDAVEVNFNCSERDLANLNPYEAVVAFLNNQNVFSVKAIIDFIEEVRQSIDSAYDKTNNEREWKTIVSVKTLDLIEKHKTFKNAIQIGDKSVRLTNIIDLDWRDMSSGEKAYLNLFSRFNYAKELILDNLKGTSYQKVDTKLPDIIYILIDEGEIGFHLQWQKEYIKKLYDVLPQILKFDGHEVKLQIIFTTHSPISLSDMPNDRVIYLKDGKVSKERRKTFGANISDLFADSFFFSNGLIGDFAKSKINKTIDWLRNTKDPSDSEYHKNVIANIDETTIQRKLAEMFSDKMKINLTKELEKEEIKNQIEKLKEDFKSKHKEDYDLL